MGTEALGSLEGLLGTINNGDVCRGECNEGLNTNMAESARTNDNGMASRSSYFTAFLTAWYAVRPASASAAMSLGWREASSLTTARALVLRNSAIPPSELRPGKLEFEQCESCPARQAGHSPHVTRGCMITVSPTLTLETALPIFFYPASVFVAEDVGEVGVLDRGPLAFDDVEVCTTETGCADFDDDIPRPCDLWIVDFIKGRHFLVFVNSYGFHCTLQFSVSALTRGTCKCGSGHYSSQ